MANICPRIALVFDFDDTLGPDSTSSFLEKMGIDPHRFWTRHAGYLKVGWDPIPAYLQMMVEESEKRPKSRRITRKKLNNFGSRLENQPGLKMFFSRIRKYVKQRSPETEIFFFIISSGIGDIICHFPFANQFTHIWSSNFSYNRDGEINGIRNVVSFTDKTRFLFQIQKGIFGPESEADPFAVNRRVFPEQFFIPFSNMVMIGDGFTDVPCFSLLQKNGGQGIGVYDREAADRWGRAWGLMDEQRVGNMVAADYRPQTGLDDAIVFALNKIICSRK